MQFQGPPVAGDRFVQFLQCPIDYAETIVERGVVGLQFNSSSDVFGGSLRIAELMGGRTEKMPCVGVVRFDGQHLPIRLLGQRQSARAMVGQSLR